MPVVTVVHAYSMRPNTMLHPTLGQIPIFEIVQETGAHLAVVLSGEGMAQLAKDIPEFLHQHPALAVTQSLKPQ